MASLMLSPARTCLQLPVTQRGAGARSVSRAQPARAQRVRAPRSAALVVKAAKGFASGGGSSGKQSTGKGAKVDKGWEASGFMFDELQDKKGKPFISKIAANDLAYAVFKVGDSVYATEANSTAYQYPVIDAEIIEGADGLQLKVPLDGTIYDLNTGAVLEWCPQDTLMRKFLGTLKKSVTPVPLKVFDTKVGSNGEVIVKLSPREF